MIDVWLIIINDRAIKHLLNHQKRDLVFPFCRCPFVSLRIFLGVLCNCILVDNLMTCEQILKYLKKNFLQMIFYREITFFCQIDCSGFLMNNSISVLCSGYAQALNLMLTRVKRIKSLQKT